MGAGIAVGTAITACDLNPTSINKDALFSATISDSPAPAGVAGAAEGPAGTPAMTGSLVGKAWVAVYRKPGGWQGVGDTTDIAIPLQDDQVLTLAADVVVPAGTYTQARLYLYDCRIDLASGSTLEGAALVAPVSLTVGGRDSLVVVLRPFPSVTVRGNVDGEIHFNLGARTWVTDKTVRDLIIQDDVVQEAVGVSAQTRQH